MQTSLHVIQIVFLPKTCLRGMPEHPEAASMQKVEIKDKVSANLQLTINSSSLTSISIDSYKLCFKNQSCPTCTTQTAQSNKRT
jgi:hypothetical protein